MTILRHSFKNCSKLFYYFIDYLIPFITIKLDTYHLNMKMKLGYIHKKENDPQVVPYAWNKF